MTKKDALTIVLFILIDDIMIFQIFHYDGKDSIIKFFIMCEVRDII